MLWTYLAGERMTAWRALRQVVTDVRELVLQLAPKEHHRHDDGDGDHDDDERIFDEALAFVVAPERHGTPLPASRLRPRAAARLPPARARPRQPPTATGPSVLREGVP